jgi:hypothetical protein
VVFGAEEAELVKIYLDIRRFPAIDGGREALPLG